VAGKTWLTYRASPLHAFKEERLADYAASLRRHMTADCQEAVGQRWRFLAAAYRLPGLAERTHHHLSLSRWPSGFVRLLTWRDVWLQSTDGSLPSWSGSSLLRVPPRRPERVLH